MNLRVFNGLFPPNFQIQNRKRYFPGSTHLGTDDVCARYPQRQLNVGVLMLSWCRLFIRIALLPLLVIVPVSAQVSTQSLSGVPNLIRFSGTLPNVTEPRLFGLTFALYKEQRGGAALWIETQNVQVGADGRFSVALGANHAGGVPIELFTTGEARWLGIQPENLPEQERVLLTAVPYAAKAADAETLGGKPLSAFLLASSTDTAVRQAVSRSTTTTAQTLTFGGTSSLTTAPAWVPNYVPKYIDAATLGNSTMVDVGGRIGIGTSSPESLLDVVGNSGQMVKIGNVPWAFRFGSLQSGTQFIGIAVKKTAANNNYVASSADIGTVNHLAMEFNYDGSWRLKQQAHQPDGAILNLVTNLSLTNAGNFGIGVDKPVQKMELAGNLKINGTGNGIMFPDGTVLKSGAVVAAAPAVTAGAGLASGGTSAQPTLSLDTQYTDGRYAGLGAANAFNADQTFNKNLIAKGSVITGPQDVTGVIKLHGTGNGIVFPDGSVQTTATAQVPQTSITAGEGVLLAGTANSPIIGLNTAYTDARYAGTNAAQNVFAGDQVFNKSVTVAGPLSSGSQNVVGDVSVSGVVSAGSVQGRAKASVVAGVAVSAVAEGEDGTALDVVASGVSGPTTGIHSSVYSFAGTAGLFDNIAGGPILLGRVKIGDYWVRRFRVDGNGRVYANNGYATGGADFAESFAVNGAKEEYEPGDVLAIDTTGTRRVARTDEPYSTLVAGVYSTKPGVIASPYDMDHESNLTREVPLAVVGVVPCKVTTQNGPIAVGDLLVSASVPGYAMKGTDRSRMVGAIIGKALQSLDSGTGLIEILVSLQ